MKLMIQNARVSFANGLYKASAFEAGQAEKFGADFILTDKTTVLEVRADGTKVKTTLKAAELAVANEAWKGKGASMLEDLEASKKAYRNGNKRKNKNGEVYEGYEGNWYITAKNTQRPTLLDKARQPVTEEDGIIYSGCFVNVSIDLYANTKPATKGVFAALKGVQFAGDGEAFGGGGTARADEFDEVTEGADADDIA